MLNFFSNLSLLKLWDKGLKFSLFYTVFSWPCVHFSSILWPGLVNVNLLHTTIKLIRALFAEKERNLILDAKSKKLIVLKRFQYIIHCTFCIDDLLNSLENTSCWICNEICYVAVFPIDLDSHLILNCMCTHGFFFKSDWM